MKKFVSASLAALLLTTSVFAAGSSDKLIVTGDRVSLRTRPDADSSEVLDRVMAGDELNRLGETNGWVAVQAPSTLNFWIHQKYVENGRTTPNKLNVRSGPSQNYAVMHILDRGSQITVRDTFNEWYKIAPPVGSKVWISKDFVNPAKAPEPKEELKPLVLKEDTSKKQGAYTEIGGILQHANPGLYKLVIITDEMEETLCLVRGNKEQLEEFINQSVLLKGKLYWALDVKNPIIQPTVIVPSPILKQ